MKENKIYCDHCGKEIDTMRDYNDLQIDIGHKWYNTDLCIECLDKLYDIVLNFCKKQDHPTEKGETERQIQTAKTMIKKMVSYYDQTEKGGEG